MLQSDTGKYRISNKTTESPSTCIKGPTSLVRSGGGVAWRQSESKTRGFGWPSSMSGDYSTTAKAHGCVQKKRTDYRRCRRHCELLFFKDERCVQEVIWKQFCLHAKRLWLQGEIRSVCTTRESETGRISATGPVTSSINLTLSFYETHQF